MSDNEDFFNDRKIHAKQNTEPDIIRVSEDPRAHALKQGDAEAKSSQGRLHEIERQLERAETRCNTLKGQVKYMKMLYNGMSSVGAGEGPGQENNEITKKAQPRHLSVESYNLVQAQHKEPKKAKTHHHHLPDRDKNKRHLHTHKHLNDSTKRTSSNEDGNQKGTNVEMLGKEEPSRDTEHNRHGGRWVQDGGRTGNNGDNGRHIMLSLSGDVVNPGAERSIHNIVSDITHSVNKLSQLHLQIGKSVTNTSNQETEGQNPKHNSGIPPPPPMPANLIGPSKHDPAVQGIRDVECQMKNNRHDPAHQPEKPYQTDPVKIEQLVGSITSKARVTKARHKRSKSVVARQSSSTGKKGSGISLAEIKKRIKNYAKEKRSKNIPPPGVNAAPQIEARFKKRMVNMSKPLVVNKTFTVIGDGNTSNPPPPVSTYNYRNNEGNHKGGTSTIDTVSTNKNNTTDKIIELYHNSAVQMITASEDSISPNKMKGDGPGVNNQHPTKNNQNMKKRSFHIQPYVQKENYPMEPNIPMQPSMGQQNMNYKMAQVNMNQMNQRISQYEPIPNILQQYRHNAHLPNFRPRTEAMSPRAINNIEGASTYSKNYELPTIASKMKQVAKNYFQNFTFRTIPFVVARSTSPSHNLGINIQQVLSIMKGRKPVSGISPTLAYNIELAATKLGSRPFSALVSNLGSRLTSRCMCPAARRFNMAQLQEQAKNSSIPEETMDCFDQESCFDATVIQDPNNNASLSNYPQNKSWIVDPQRKRDQCNCLPHGGVNFNDVCNKYMQPPNVEATKNVLGRASSKLLRGSRSQTRRPWNYNICRNNFGRRGTPLYPPGVPKNNLVRAATAVPAPMNINTKAAAEIVQSAAMLPPKQTAASRERNLKEVLNNLHVEFSKLNDRYERLKESITNGNISESESQLRELEALERDLLNKEDEITMVMNLYKEVSTLKRELRQLKKGPSQTSVTVTPYTRYKDYKDANAAGHLTKLLRHIQQFQESLRAK